jgi:hypothetical protein
LQASWSASTPGQITLTWPSVSGATGYVVERRSGAEWEVVGSPSTAAYTDTTVAAGRTYAYRVYAVAGNNDSNYSNTDVATTMTFTEPQEGGYVDDVAPIASMLDAVNKVRAAAGWPAVTWSNILAASDPVPSPGQLITARQVTACRVRMNEALLALGSAVVPYTDPQLDLVDIKALYIREVQQRAR